MTQKTELDPANEYQIHKGKIIESESGPESKFIEDLGHIENRELEQYEDLNVTDITDDNMYSFESFDSGNRLVKTEHGEFLIVHHRVVETGPWSS